MMSQNDNFSIDLLEEKVSVLINNLEILREENSRLKQKNQEFIAIIAEKDQIIQRLKSETEKSQEIQSEIDAIKENDDRIKSKVENLLLKLKEFEDIE